MGKQDYATHDESDAVAVGIAWIKFRKMVWKSFCVLFGKTEQKRFGLCSYTDSYGDITPYL